MLVMHRLRKTAIAIAFGETVTFGSSTPTAAQTAAQPVASETPPKIEQSSEGRASPAGVVPGPTTGSTKPPSSVGGGYTWHNKAPVHKTGHRVAQKVDPTRPQAKGPEFVVAPDGTSHISLQISQHLEISLVSRPGELVFELPNAQVAVPNDSNPLVTTHFATVVRKVRLTAHGKNARLLIELRESITPTYQVRALTGGAVLLEISIPKPSHTMRPRTESRAKAHSKPARTRK